MSTAQNGESRAVLKSCFIIGPIGDHLAEVGEESRQVYEAALEVVEKVIVPACSSNGITNPIRSDLIASPGEIPEQVFELIRTSDLVIADLTGGNANVMYELGLRHTLDKCTISIGEKDRLPFDISVIRTVLFKRTGYGLVEARNELQDMIAECLKGNYRPVTATRLWLGSRFPPPEAPNSPEIPAEEEPGFLEKLAAMEEALPRLVQVMTDIAAFGQRAHELVERRTSELPEGPASSAKQKLAVAIGLASDIDRLALEFEQLVDTYEREIATVDAGVRYIIATAANIDPSERPQLLEFSEALHEGLENISRLAATFEDAAKSTATLGDAARPLRKGATRLARGFQRAAAASSTFAVWDTLLREAIAQLPS